MMDLNSGFARSSGVPQSPLSSFSNDLSGKPNRVVDVPRASLFSNVAWQVFNRLKTTCYRGKIASRRGIFASPSLNSDLLEYLPANFQCKIGNARASDDQANFPNKTRPLKTSFRYTETLVENIKSARLSKGWSIYNRTHDIFLYFNLPYDAPPPEEE